MKAKPLGPPHSRGECDFCRWPMKQRDRVAWNGGVGHARCVAHHERLVLGEDAGPGLAEDLADTARIERMQAFFARLADEAEHLGVERAVLQQAISGAFAATVERISP